MDLTSELSHRGSESWELNQILSEWVSESHSVVSYSLRPHGLYSSWNAPGQNTGVGSLSLLQEIFPTQGSNPGLPHCRRILYQLSHQRSPRMLEWVAYPFSSGSSQPRNQTGVSCIAGSLQGELQGKPMVYSVWTQMFFLIVQMEKLGGC